MLVPGQSLEARMVLSYSGKLPHMGGRQWEFVHILWQLPKSTKICNNFYPAGRGRKGLTSPNCWPQVCQRAVGGREVLFFGYINLLSRLQPELRWIPPQIFLWKVLHHQQLLVTLTKVVQYSCQGFALHISAYYNRLCSKHLWIFTYPTLHILCTHHITKELSKRQVTHFRFPHRISFIISHWYSLLPLLYLATLVFALGARTSIPKLLNHKTCTSSMKNGNSLHLQIQALHNPNLEMFTTTVEECIWMCWPYFTLNDLLLPPEVVCHLTATHKEMLLSEFGLAIWRCLGCS